MKRAGELLLSLFPCFFFCLVLFVELTAVVYPTFGKKKRIRTDWYAQFQTGTLRSPEEHDSVKVKEGVPMR